MLKIGMCDDELNIAQPISKIIESKIIENDLDAEISIVTDDQNKIYEMIKNKELDVLILDIDFGKDKKSGIDFASKLRDINKDFYLVFLYAYSRYMPISFIDKTFDYLIKPVNAKVISDLIYRLKKDVEQNKKIFLKVNNSLFVRVDDILYIEKQGNKAIIYTNTNTYKIFGSLNEILDKLPNNFKKCHRSYIINENKILSIDKKNSIAYLGKDIYCPINTQYLNSFNF